LKDFFPTLTFQQARRVFLRAGYPFSVAHVLGKLCSREDVLPIGAPTSPALANQICQKLDKRLWLLAKNGGFHYSRYADDLVFSSSDRRFASLVPFLKEIITDEGFCVNERKLAIVRRNSCQKVTGIVVNRKPNLPQAEFKRIRAVVHNCLRNGVEAEFQKWRDLMAKDGKATPESIEKFGQQLAGRIAFARHVHPKRGEKIWEQFRRIDFA
jgi:retron-type reverse transcriptase